MSSSVPTRALVIPRFGSLTEDVIDLVGQGADTLHTYVFDESVYERRLVRPLTQVVRSLTHLLPGTRVKRAFELLFAFGRFRTDEMVADLLRFCDRVRADHLIFIKPSFLSEEEFARVRSKLEAKVVTIVLWDAMWRTPRIAHLLPHADAVFTTEPSDVAVYPSMVELPLPRPLPKADGQRNDVQRTPVYFGCASWSLDRYLQARGFVAAVARCGVTYQVNLVTDRMLPELLNRFAGIDSARLEPEENWRLVQGCEVQVDFGRRGQTSPSERLVDSAMAGVLLLTRNPRLSGVGYPVVDASRSWAKGVASAQESIGRESKGDRVKSWQSRSELRRYFVSRVDWSAMVTSAEREQATDLGLVGAEMEPVQC